MGENKRNYGIDLLRILSMQMVCLLHVLGEGGILSAVQIHSAKYNIIWFLRTAAYCAVNCYALISGYVGIEAKFRYSKILKLWLQVVFYTVGITAIFYVFSPEQIGRRELFSSVSPVMSVQYWYFTSYFCMFFFIPFLNRLINGLPSRQRRILVITIIVLFSILPALFGRDVFGTGEGYSVLWLVCLYLIGGCIKKSLWIQKIHYRTALVIYLASTVLAWIVKGRLIAYTSPAMLLSGIALLILFANCKLPDWMFTKITFLSPLSFSVYLIHAHPLIWTNILHSLRID